MLLFSGSSRQPNGDSMWKSTVEKEMKEVLPEVMKGIQEANHAGQVTFIELLKNTETHRIGEHDHPHWTLIYPSHLVIRRAKVVFPSGSEVEIGLSQEPIEAIERAKETALNRSHPKEKPDAGI